MMANDVIYFVVPQLEQEFSCYNFYTHFSSLQIFYRFQKAKERAGKEEKRNLIFTLFPQQNDLSYVTDRIMLIYSR
jgi:hypothetical protein